MLAKPFSKGWRRSAVHIIVAAAMPAACWPVPVAAARKARSSRLVASDTASGAGGTDPMPGAAANRMPVPGAMRPVPNRLFIEKAQATALPSGSMVTSPALAPDMPPPPNGADPPCNAWKAEAVPAAPSAAAGRKNATSLPTGTRTASCTSASVSRSSGEVSPPPATTEASSNRCDSVPWYNSPTPPERIWASVAPRSSWISRSPPRSGPPPRAPKTRRACGSFSSGAATTARSAASAALTSVPKRARSSAGRTSCSKRSRPPRVCSRNSPRGNIGTAAGRSVPDGRAERAPAGKETAITSRSPRL